MSEILTDEMVDRALAVWFRNDLDAVVGPTGYWHHKEMRAALSAALPLAVAGERENWQPVETIPTAAGTRIRALVETELFMEEHNPALLMGGWKRCAARDRVVGWRADTGRE